MSRGRTAAAVSGSGRDGEASRQISRSTPGGASGRITCGQARATARANSGPSTAPYSSASEDAQQRIGDPATDEQDLTPDTLDRRRVRPDRQIAPPSATTSMGGSTVASTMRTTACAEGKSSRPAGVSRTRRVVRSSSRMLRVTSLSRTGGNGHWAQDCALPPGGWSALQP